jgi:small subunit ribosomal protein S3Ae
VSDVITKDGIKVRIKAIALALGRAQRLQEKLIRKIMHDVAARNAKDMDFDKFMHNVVIGRIPSAMYRESGKIYPLKRMEVKKTEVMSR